MTRLRALALTSMLAAAALVPACATTSTTTTTWTDPQAGGGWVRPGQVASVQEVIQRTQGDPAGGAVAGAIIGGLLFGGRHGPSLIGAVGGAAVGAAASQGGAESRTYHVVVRFDDGGYETFTYAGYPPFGPGERVVLTPQGLGRG